MCYTVLMQIFTYANQVLPNLNELYGRKNLADVNRYGKVLSNFRQLFGHKVAYVASSPGRVELIGNHLDHNGGKVIACTVNLDIVAAFAPSGGDVISIIGENRPKVRVCIYDDAPCTRSAGLVKGVVRYLAEHGYKVGGFDAYTESVIPTGAGVSSSAAFELLIGKILSALYNDDAIPIETLARAGQFAENVYFGKPCGLLDQSVIAVGGAVQLDFSAGIGYRKLDADLRGLSLVLINTGGSHSRLSDLYAAIPADMKAVARYFGKERLVDVAPDVFFARFDEAVHSVGELSALRARHFFTEQARVEKTSALLSSQQGLNTAELMSLINASGKSSLYDLQNCAVDKNDTAIFDILKFAHGVCPCGARVHGGGFAGTVLCVLSDSDSARFLSAANAAYGSDKVYPLRLRSLGTVVL